MKVKAIQRLRPNAEFVLRGDVLEWIDTTQTEPTQAEIDAEIAYLEGDEYKKVLLKAEMKAEAIRIAQERVLDAEIKKAPYLSAMADVEAKINSGEINENARKAIRDEIQSKRTAK